MATRPLMLRIGYDRMEDEHRRAAEARQCRDLGAPSGSEAWTLRATRAAAAWTARVARIRPSGHHGATTARPG